MCVFFCSSFFCNCVRQSVCMLVSGDGSICSVSNRDSNSSIFSLITIYVMTYNCWYKSNEFDPPSQHLPRCCPKPLQQLYWRQLCSFCQSPMYSNSVYLRCTSTVTLNIQFMKNASTHSVNKNTGFL